MFLLFCSDMLTWVLVDVYGPILGRLMRVTKANISNKRVCSFFLGQTSSNFQTSLPKPKKTSRNIKKPSSWKISLKTSCQKGCPGALAITALLTKRPESLGRRKLSSCHLRLLVNLLISVNPLVPCRSFSGFHRSFFDFNFSYNIDTFEGKRDAVESWFSLRSKSGKWCQASSPREPYVQCSPHRTRTNC